MSEIEQTPPSEETPELLAEPIITEDIVEAEQPVTRQRSVARSAGVVSVAIMFSRVLGLVREQVFAYFFGGGR